MKHFVERRKEELNDRYARDVVLSRLYFAVNSVEITIRRHDSCIEEDNKIIYSRYFATEYKSFLRIVTEIIDNTTQIKSIHYKKNKKAT